MPGLRQRCCPAVPEKAGGNLIDKAALTKARLPEREVEVPGVGTVRVRGLSRAESLRIGQLAGDGDLDGSEVYLLAAGMVDPALSEDDVIEWRKAAPGDELTPVVEAILVLSGLKEESFKEAVSTFRVLPGDDERLLPGPDAEHDGGPLAS